VSTPLPLEGLHPYEYEHPFDAKALDALQNTRGLDMLVKWFTKQAVERLVTVQSTGSCLRITNDSYPNIHELLDKVCEIINLPSRPDLYLEWEYGINGGTLGDEHPIIVLSSGSIDLLDETELLYLIGHEVGHIKSRHYLYHLMAKAVPRIGDIVGQASLGIGKLLSQPLQYALLHWSRMSEFTADRAGLLACQDIDAAIRVMMKWSGMPLKHYNDMRFEAFLKQAKTFEKLDYDTLSKTFKFLWIMHQTHPLTVIRAAELIRWIDSGEYDQTLQRQTKDQLYKRRDGTNEFCRNCDFRLKGKEKFCPSCGNQLKAEIANP
jgi:Zn-dependent protease with chaperone function